MILVVGATGHLGGRITRRLLRDGQAVRMLIRPDSHYEDLERAGCEPSIGDIKYPQSFGPAFNGIHTVITTASATQFNFVDTYENVDLQGNHNLIEAAHAAGVQHFVFVSALGADLSHPHMYFRAKAESEATLRVSGMPYTILSATAFMETWIERLIERPLREGLPVPIIGEGQRRHSFVSLDDVAAFATAVVDNPAAVNRTIAVSGPEALSWLEVIDMVGNLIGQQLPVKHVIPGEPIPGLLPELSQLAANFEAFSYVLDMTQTARKFGVTLTPLQTVAARMLGELTP